MPQITNERTLQAIDMLRLSYDVRFDSRDAHLDLVIVIAVTLNRLPITAEGHATGAFETNRAGFTVLRPITGVAGQRVNVMHSDGSSEAAVFPDLIAPW